MKPAAILLGLACVVLAQGALGEQASGRKAAVVKKTGVPKKATSVPSTASVKLAQAKNLPRATVFTPVDADRTSDQRELVRMPSVARLAMRAEMRDRMGALDAVLQRMRDGQVVEAGEIARMRLGVAVWGGHDRLPHAARPEQYLPPAMQTLALDGYKAASDFATVALTGDQHTATAMLPQLTGSCAHCHQAYRIR